MTRERLASLQLSVYYPKEMRCFPHTDANSDRKGLTWSRFASQIKGDNRKVSPFLEVAGTSSHIKGE